MTNKDYMSRFQARMKKFGITRVPLRISASERAMIQAGMKIENTKTMQEFISVAVRNHCKELGLSLVDFNEKLQELESDE